MQTSETTTIECGIEFSLAHIVSLKISVGDRCTIVNPGNTEAARIPSSNSKKTSQIRATENTNHKPKYLIHLSTNTYTHNILQQPSTKNHQLRLKKKRLTINSTLLPPRRFLLFRHLQLSLHCRTSSVVTPPPPDLPSPPSSTAAQPILHRSSPLRLAVCG